MVATERLENIDDSLEKLHDISTSWPIGPDVESMETFNNTSKYVVEEVQESIYESLTSMSGIDLEDVSEDAWPQEMLTLYSQTGEIDESKLDELQKMADIAKHVFSAQTKANQLFDEEKMVTVNDVKIELELALSLVEQIK